MLHRICTVQSFIDRFNADLQTFEHIIEIPGNICLVTADTVAARNIIVGRLKTFNVNCRTFNREDLSMPGKLGAAIYSGGQDTSSIAVIDLADVMSIGSEISKDNLQILDEINANRDVFLRCFRNTVIIMSKSMSYWFLALARDICSCVVFHLDVSGWYTIPEIVPVFHLKFPQQAIKVENEMEWEQYSSIQKDILNISEYSPGIEKSFWHRIYRVKKEYHSELLYLLLNRLVRVPARPGFSEMQADVLAGWDIEYCFSALLRIEVLCLIGEFFFLRGQYGLARNYYQDALYSIGKEDKLSEIVSEEEFGYIRDFIVCNSITCGYLISINDSDSMSFYSRISAVLNIARSCESDFIKVRVLDYMFVYKTCLARGHYVNFLDMYTLSHDLDIGHSNICKNFLYWINYEVLGEISAPNNMNLDSPWSRLHVDIVKMIQTFRTGDYLRSMQFYKRIKKQLRCTNHQQMKDIVKCIRTNMKFLRNMEELGSIN